ncbi:uncharacterized protein N7473_006952 [Penicillium subrubescens]|jgi:hypothetical protein|uniref:BZIP domain-containing protein n=1 Tax=Penicillium subrubescens TaxID=1316194 RepID=A0A1Q5TG39_9EURO|nr:uncharacterized protein N7473_006952 [Penicillium subrubescens]KAJ5890724.1 hypothetical protein N7473_006952 [Penicillium subrubescens]OKO99145.1 hypothetical protein PENSUB_8532 [Penicillium subrubescens]
MKKKVNTETTQKQGGSATLTRARDNQRRSRARRKEYIQHLEQRLRSFESQGVVASQEIQQAGRKVANENSLLRSLLLLRGVTQDEIEDFLKSHAEHTTPRVIVGSTSPHHGLPMDFVVSGRACDRKPSTLPRGDDFDESRDQCRSVEVHANSNTYELTTNQPSTRIQTNIPENAPTLQRYNKGHQEQGQFTSCESAARIIASLRGYSDTNDLRSELGCGVEANCMVKNLSLFEMLDK